MRWLRTPLTSVFMRTQVCHSVELRARVLPSGSDLEICRLVRLNVEG